MLPQIPYAGMLRPGLITSAIVIMIIVLNATKNRPWHKKLLIATFLLYLLLLVYATFLSRTVSDALSYRLSLLKAARESFSLEGGLSQILPRLIKGDFSGISLTNLRSLEGIFINILIFIPMGYLIPSIFHRIRWYHVICIAALSTVFIEVVQLITRLGMFDLDDILNNAVGTVVGMWLLKIVSQRG